MSSFLVTLGPWTMWRLFSDFLISSPSYFPGASFLCIWLRYLFGLCPSLDNVIPLSPCGCSLAKLEHLERAEFTFALLAEIFLFISSVFTGNLSLWRKCKIWDCTRNKSISWCLRSWMVAFVWVCCCWWWFLVLYSYKIVGLKKTVNDRKIRKMSFTAADESSAPLCC